MSALHAVGIVLEVVAVRADGARDLRQGDGAVPVDDNGVLPFGLEQRANHIVAVTVRAVMAVPVLQPVGLAAVLLSIGSIPQSVHDVTGNPANLQALDPVSAEVTMAEVNQLADSSFVASHSGVNYHPVANAAIGIAGVVEVLAKGVAGGFHFKVGFSHVLSGFGFFVLHRKYNPSSEPVKKIINLFFGSLPYSLLIHTCE